MNNTAPKLGILDPLEQSEPQFWKEVDGLDCDEVWLTDPRFTNVRCDITPHRIVLHGAVSSFHHKQLAQEYLSPATNPREIVNCLTVRPAG